MVHIVLGIGLTVVLLVITTILLKKRQGERAEQESYKRVSFERLLLIVKNEMAEATRDSEIHAFSDEDYEAKLRSRRRLSEALRDSTYGVPAARDVVIAAIKDIVQRELPTVDAVCDFIPFDRPDYIDVEMKWEMLCVKLQPWCDLGVVNYLQERYNIAKPRILEGSEIQRPVREFDESLLNIIYRSEMSRLIREKGVGVTYDDMTEVIARKVFSMYHGFGVIDTLMTLRIDGINLGVSGIIRTNDIDIKNVKYRSTNSVWVMVGSAWVMFSFLDFKQEGEMKRVINQLVSWGTSAPMSEKCPYKVVDGYDGSRRTAVRPGAGESWAIFIRKFVLTTRNLTKLLKKPTVHNWQLPLLTIYFLIKSEQTSAFTGQQGTGKTTLMAAAMEHIEDKNIRCLEMSFELALREIYPEKNTFTVKPTEYVSAANLQDLLKKTDGWVSSVGEVAEDIVAARMIQFGLIASACTYFSHHGKDDQSLVDGLTNSLVACGEYHDHFVAGSTVLDVIKHNVHLMKYRGERVVEYISQIIKEDTIAPYPEIQDLLEQAKAALNADDSEKLASVFLAYTQLTREYYTRRTDRVKFKSRYIVKFNRETMTYEPGEWYTDEIFESMYNNMNELDRVAFLKFKEHYFDTWDESKMNDSAVDGLEFVKRIHEEVLSAAEA